MRALVAEDLGRIAELIRGAEAAAAAEDWNRTIVALREASYDCLSLSNALTRTTQVVFDDVEIRDPDSAEFWAWH